MSSKLRGERQASGGFTIVELLIATLVFSMVLILITVGVLTFTKSYYRGVNQSNTQGAARAIIENISQAIQFSGDQITTSLTGPNGSQGICIGNQRYSFLLHRQLWDDGTPSDVLHQSSHALILDKPGTCGGMQSQDMSAPVAGSTEMLQPRMRLSKLQVTQVAGATSMYQITVRVVYGDDDLLNNPAGDDASCKFAISGSQYCAQSELTTTVKRRLGQ